MTITFNRAFVKEHHAILGDHKTAHGRLFVKDTDVGKPQIGVQFLDTKELPEADYKVGFSWKEGIQDDEHLSNAHLKFDCTGYRSKAFREFKDAVAFKEVGKNAFLLIF